MGDFEPSSVPGSPPDFGMIGLGTFGSVSLDNFSAPAGRAARVADQAVIEAVRVVGSNDADLTH